MKWFIALSLVTLNFLDGLLTITLPFMSDEIELNPLFVSLFGTLDYRFITLKIVYAAFASFLTVMFWEKYKSVRVASIIVTTIYLFVVFYLGCLFFFV